MQVSKNDPLDSMTTKDRTQTRQGQSPPEHLKRGRAGDRIDPQQTTGGEGQADGCLAAVKSGRLPPCRAKIMLTVTEKEGQGVEKRANGEVTARLNSAWTVVSSMIDHDGGPGRCQYDAQTASETGQAIGIVVLLPHSRPCTRNTGTVCR